MLATILYGISSNEVSKVQGINGLQLTALAFLILLPFGITALLATDLHAAVQNDHWLKSLGYIGILSVFGSAISLALFYYLIHETSPVFASMTTYFVPVVATLWGIFDGERLLPNMPVSVLIILTGVYLINRPGLLRNLRNLIG